MLMTPEPVANDDGGSEAGADAHQGRKCKPDADTREHHTGHEGRHVGVRAEQHCPDHKPARERQDAGGHHGGRTEACDQATGEQQRCERDKQRTWRDREAGL
jgi:hypothetical protein